MAAIVWAIVTNLRYQAPAKGLQKLREGDVYDGLCALAEADRWPAILSFLKTQIKLPDENLRPRLMETVQQVRALRTAAQDTSPNIPQPIREQILKESNDALDALWRTCQRLSGAARLEVDANLLKSELETERANLQQLFEATKSAKVELARLNLAGGKQEISEATAQFGQLGWAAREMRRVDDAMWCSDDETSNTSSSAPPEMN